MTVHEESSGAGEWNLLERSVCSNRGPLSCRVQQTLVLVGWGNLKPFGVTPCLYQANNYSGVTPVHDDKWSLTLPLFMIFIPSPSITFHWSSMRFYRLFQQNLHRTELSNQLHRVKPSRIGKSIRASFICRSCDDDDDYYFSPADVVYRGLSCYEYLIL